MYLSIKSILGKNILKYQKYKYFSSTSVERCASSSVSPSSTCSAVAMFVVLYVVLLVLSESRAEITIWICNE